MTREREIRIMLKNGECICHKSNQIERLIIQYGEGCVDIHDYDDGLIIKFDAYRTVNIKKITSTTLEEDDNVVKEAKDVVS